MFEDSEESHPRQTTAGRVIWVVPALELKKAFPKSSNQILYLEGSGEVTTSSPQTVHLDQSKSCLSSELPSEPEKKSEELQDVLLEYINGPENAGGVASSPPQSISIFDQAHAQATQAGVSSQPPSILL